VWTLTKFAREAHLGGLDESLSESDYETIFLNRHTRLVLIAGFAGIYDVLRSTASIPTSWLFVIAGSSFVA